MIISRSVLHRMSKVSDKFIGKIKTHFVFNNFFFNSRAIYEIMCRNTVELGRSQMAIWHMCIADNVQKYCRAGHVTDGNMAHVHCMMDT